MTRYVWILWILYTWCILFDKCGCEKYPQLDIFPSKSVQWKPVGKSLILTCRPNVNDASLVSDLQWKDNNNITIGSKSSNGNNQPLMYTESLPGEGLALIMPSLTSSMGGKYYCSGFYANTEFMETSVVIETFVPITWKNAPENQYPIMGSDYIVKCEVTANPNPTVDWLRNGNPIKNGEKYIIETHGLLIRNVKATDDGIYTCRAAVIYTGELVERNIRVEIFEKPVITYVPRSIEAIEGSPFSANCTAVGKPVPEIQWIKDETQQNLGIADRFHVDSHSGVISITNAKQEDRGVYTCIVRNDAGVAEAKTVLSVVMSPAIFEFYNATEAISKEVALTCRSKGRPAPTITFRRWGNEEEYNSGAQVTDDRIVLEQYFNEEEGESSGTLRISRTVRADDGLYQCIAKNKGGIAFKTGHITVQFPPDFSHMRNLPPTYSWDERKANISCLAVGVPNATIEWRWNGNRVKDLFDKNLEIIGTGPRSDLIVHPVSRNYYSAYKCIATNIHGMAEHDLELKEARVPDFVVSAVPQIITATTITFDIIGPATEKGLPLIAYSVQYKEEYNPDWWTAQNRSWSPDSPYIIEGLKPQTSYNFRFAARNQVGLGPWGANKILSTPRRSVPEVPKTLHFPLQSDEEGPIVISPNSDIFELRWSVPGDNGEPINFYQIKYCPGHKVNGSWIEIETNCKTNEVVDSTHYELTQLNGNAYYRIELRAHNAIGFSMPTTMIIKTIRNDSVSVGKDFGTMLYTSTSSYNAVRVYFSYAMCIAVIVIHYNLKV